MSKTFVVPLDGSSESEECLPVARLFADRHGGKLSLVSVVEVNPEFDAWIDTAPYSLDDELDTWLNERQGYLNQIASDLGEDVATEVRVGQPAEEIRNVVADLAGPVIVMASHGRGGLQQLVLGSVALKLIHDVDCPVIVVHMQGGDTQLPATLDDVLIPTDGTDFSESIIDEALEIVAEPKPRLHLTQVVVASTWATHSMNAGLVSEYLEASRDATMIRLEELRSSLAERSYETHAQLCDGRTDSQILEQATECGADLIAMATHGRGGVGRLVLGSVTQRVLHRANVPLLLIKPKA